MSIYDKIISNIENDSLSTYDMLYLEREYSKNKHNLSDEFKSNNFRLSMESMVDVAKELKVIEEMKTDNSVYNSVEAFQSECYAYMDSLVKLNKDIEIIINNSKAANDERIKKYAEELHKLCTNESSLFNDENVLVKVKDLPYEELYNKNTNIGKYNHDYLHRLFDNDHEWEHIIYSSDLQFVLLLKYLKYVLENGPFIEANIPVIVNDNVVDAEITIGEYSTLLYNAYISNSLAGMVKDAINKIIDILRNTLSDAYIEPNSPTKIELIVQQISSVANLHDKLKQYTVGMNDIDFV